MDLLLLLLFSASVLCIVLGCWVAYRDRYRLPPIEADDAAPLDEELLIFNRVTAGLAGLPRVEDPRTLRTAQAEVMQEVGKQYGLSSAEAEEIYWRVWRYKHGDQQ